MVLPSPDAEQGDNCSDTYSRYGEEIGSGLGNLREGHRRCFFFSLSRKRKVVGKVDMEIRSREVDGWIGREIR